MRLRQIFSDDESSEQGATLVETAVSFVPFFILTYGLVFFINWAYTTMTLQFALNETARWASLGQKLTDPNTGQPASRERSIELKLAQNLNKFGMTDGDVTFRICPTNRTNCTTNTAVASGRNALLIATKPTTNFFQLPALTPSASVVIRNEPF